MIPVNTGRERRARHREDGGESKDRHKMTDKRWRTTTNCLTQLLGAVRESVQKSPVESKPNTMESVCIYYNQ